MGLANRREPLEVEVPHEPGNYMTFRALSAKRLKEAAGGFAREALELVGKDGLEVLRTMSREEEDAGRAVIEEARARATAAAPDAAGANTSTSADEDALSGYSDTVLLRKGLTAWRGPDYDGSPCNEVEQDELDEVTRRWAALQILSMSRITVGEASSSGVDGAANGATPLRSASVESGTPS